MIGTIGHLGKVSPRKGLLSAALYALGASLSAAATGLLVAGLGSAANWALEVDRARLEPMALAVVGLLALLGGCWDIGLIPMRLPQLRNQVPQVWMDVFGPAKAGLLWGLYIGAGFTTLVRYSMFYVVASWVFLVCTPLRGALVFLCFGFAQGVLLLAETAALGAGRSQPFGILGLGRTRAFALVSALSLFALGAFLTTHYCSAVL